MVTETSAHRTEFDRIKACLWLSRSNAASRPGFPPLPCAPRAFRSRNVMHCVGPSLITEIRPSSRRHTHRSANTVRARSIRFKLALSMETSPVRAARTRAPSSHVATHPSPGRTITCFVCEPTLERTTDPRRSCVAPATSGLHRRDVISAICIYSTLPIIFDQLQLLSRELPWPRHPVVYRVPIEPFPFAPLAPPPRPRVPIANASHREPQATPAPSLSPRLAGTPDLPGCSRPSRPG